MLSNLFIWEIRLKKFRLCYREQYLEGQKLCKYYFLLRFCNRDATCTWSLSIYYYCWSGSRSFVIHWRRVSSYSGNVTKEKKNSSKYVWACSYFFFFFPNLFAISHFLYFSLSSHHLFSPVYSKLLLVLF